ncbi:fluoroquinolone export ABC transporter permease subunit [Paenibacillus sp. strain BS8-2]
MRRLIRTAIFDLRFQLRHGFYGVYGLIIALYLLLLYYVPDKHKELVSMLLTFSDPSAVGLIVVGGIVLLERDQGIHDSLFATPVRLWEYLGAKAVSISFLSLAAAWVIHSGAHGLPEHPVLFSIGVVLTSTLFTFLSIAVVAKAATINGFIMLSQLYALPFIIPLLGLMGFGPMMLYVAIPTNGSLMLLSSAFSPLTATEVGYAIIILLIGNAVVYMWAQHMFRRRILQQEVGG